MYQLNKKHPIVKLIKALPGVTELTLDTGHVIPTIWFEDTISDKRYEELHIAMGNKGLAISDFYAQIPEPPKDYFEENYSKTLKQLQSGKHILLWLKSVKGLMALHYHMDGMYIKIVNGEKVIDERHIQAFLNRSRYEEVCIFEITDPDAFFAKGYQCAYVPNHMQVTPRGGMGISKFRLTSTLTHADAMRYIDKYSIAHVIEFRVLDNPYTLSMLEKGECPCIAEIK